MRGRLCALAACWRFYSGGARQGKPGVRLRRRVVGQFSREAISLPLLERFNRADVDVLEIAMTRHSEIDASFQVPPDLLAWLCPLVFHLSLLDEAGRRYTQCLAQSNQRGDRRLSNATLKSRNKGAVHARPKGQLLLAIADACPVALQYATEYLANVLWVRLRHAANVVSV